MNTFFEAVTFGTLPLRPKKGVTLYCPECLENFSASRGDYFMETPTDIIACSCTYYKTPLQLVTVHTIYTPISTTDAEQG